MKPEQTPGIQADRAPKKRGRKPASQSRAVEFRSKLLTWEQTPETQRSSLRALAARLGTSHQLLGVYLKGLNNWQKRDYQHRAATIRDRAEAENRYMTAWEESLVKSLERAAFHCAIESVLTSTLKRYEEEFRKNKTDDLTRSELRIVKVLARHGSRMAQKLLEKRQINLPPAPIRAS